MHSGTLFKVNVLATEGLRTNFCIHQDNLPQPKDSRQQYILSIMASSRRRHGQDKTVLSCLVRVSRRCEHNWRQDKTVLSCLGPVSNFQVFSSPQYNWNWTVANWKLGQDKTKLSCRGVNKLLDHHEQQHSSVEILRIRCPCSVLVGFS